MEESRINFQQALFEAGFAMRASYGRAQHLLLRLLAGGEVRSWMQRTGGAVLVQPGAWKAAIYDPDQLPPQIKMAGKSYHFRWFEISRDDLLDCLALERAEKGSDDDVHLPPENRIGGSGQAGGCCDGDPGELAPMPLPAEVTCPEKPIPTDRAVRQWMRDRVAGWPEGSPAPSEDDDWKAACNHFAPGLARLDLRAIRKEETPEAWRKQGPRKLWGEVKKAVL